ncbi:MAG TPA: glycosyltransferase family 39 protein [Pirellulales bacterium]|nr:glycosyltransferase family 39 protein [Pirellulales bacterium]
MPTEPEEPSRRGPGAGLLAALLLTAALQIFIGMRSPIIAKDGMSFIRIAGELREDAAATLQLEDQHPGYPAMILAGNYLARRLPGISEFECWILGARLASGIAGVLSVAVVWLLARRLFDRRVADVAALLAAVWPLLRQNASDALSDTPHFMFYLAGVWLTCEGLVRRQARWFAAACAVSGLAYWIRPEGLIVGFTAALLLLVQLWRAEGQVRWRAVCKVAAMGLVMFAVAAPYGLLAGKLTSKKNPLQREPSDLEIAAQGVAATPGLLSEPLPGAKLPNETARPDSIVGAIAAALYELGKEIGQGFYYLFLVPLFVWLCAPSRLRPHFAATWMTTVLIFCHMAMLVLLFLTAGYISHRHVIPLVGMMLPGTAAGTVWLADRLADRWPAWTARLRIPLFRAIRAPSSSQALTAIVLFMLAGLLPKTIKPLHEVYAPLVQAALWVKQHARPGDQVLATSGYVRFYAGMPGLLLGPEVPNLPIGLVQEPDSRPWPFIVVEVDTRKFDCQQLCNPAAGYEQVLQIALHPRRKWPKVLVFASRSANVSRLAAHEAAGGKASN